MHLNSAVDVMCLNLAIDVICWLVICKNFYKQPMISEKFSDLAIKYLHKQLMILEVCPNPIANARLVSIRTFVSNLWSNSSRDLCLWTIYKSFRKQLMVSYLQRHVLIRVKFTKTSVYIHTLTWDSFCISLLSIYVILVHLIVVIIAINFQETTYGEE